MGATTKIQWCDSTVNPTMGCDGCELRNTATGTRKCYAGALHDRYGGKSKGYSPSFEVITLWPGRMAEAARWRDLTGTAREDKPWLDGLPRLIFVSDMSDSLSASVTFDYLRAELISNVQSPEGRRHLWLWLSKRPQRMADFSTKLRAEGTEWPANLWAGTSITTASTASRIPQLLKVGGHETIRFLSVEPQYEQINFSRWLPELNWVIQGGESGSGAKPFHVEWASDMSEQCRKAGVAYFLKQLGTAPFITGRPLKLHDGHGGDWAEWPETIRTREMPRVVRTS